LEGEQQKREERRNEERNSKESVILRLQRGGDALRDEYRKTTKVQDDELRGGKRKKRTVARGGGGLVQFRLLGQGDKGPYHIQRGSIVWNLAKYKADVDELSATSENRLRKELGTSNKKTRKIPLHARDIGKRKSVPSIGRVEGRAEGFFAGGIGWGLGKGLKKKSWEGGKLWGGTGSFAGRKKAENGEGGALEKRTKRKGKAKGNSCGGGRVMRIRRDGGKIIGTAQYSGGKGRERAGRGKKKVKRTTRGGYVEPSRWGFSFRQKDAPNGHVWEPD